MLVFSVDKRLRYRLNCSVAPKKLADAPEKINAAANDQNCSGRVEDCVDIDIDERRFKSNAYTTRNEDEKIEVHTAEDIEAHSLPFIIV